MVTQSCVMRSNVHYRIHKSQPLAYILTKANQRRRLLVTRRLQTHPEGNVLSDMHCAAFEVRCCSTQCLEHLFMAVAVSGNGAAYWHTAASGALRVSSVLLHLIVMVHHSTDCGKLRSVTTVLASALSQLLWET